MSDFDPYLQWLGIPPEDQPPDHYRLLGIRRFESNPEAIASATEQRMAIVRAFQTGPRGAATQPLLNQLAAAKLCLLDPFSKSEYDGNLSREAGDPSIADSLLPASLPSQESETPTQSPAPISIDTQAVSSEARHSKSTRFDWSLPVIGILLTVAVGLSIWIANVLLDTPAEVTTPVASTESPTTESPVTTSETGGAETSDAANNQLPLVQESDGVVAFTMSDAKCDGELTVETRDEGDFLVGWQSDTDSATWRFKIAKLPSQGIFRVRVTYQADQSAEGSQYVLTLDDVPQTHDIRARDQVVDDAFYLAVKRNGEHTLRFSLQNKPAAGTFGLKRLEFWVPKVGG